MKYYVAVDIGCIECGEESDVLGIFTTKKQAQKELNKASKAQQINWTGQHHFKMFEVKKLN